MTTANHKLSISAVALIALLPVASFASDAQASGRQAGGAGSVDIDEQLMAAWQLGEAEVGEAVPMEGLSFPIDHFDDGTVRAQFSADWALIPDDPAAFVRAKGVCIELYDEQGAVQGIYVAENCIFDRATKIGYCEGQVRMEYHAPGRNIRLDGQGMQWNLATRGAKILSEPKLVMSEIMGELGGAFR